jgi:hypothetical protein
LANVKNELTERLELAGEFSKRLDEFMRSKGIAAILGEGGQEELEELEKDMRAAGVAIPPPGAELEEMKRNLPDFAADLERRGLHVRLRGALEAMGTIEVVLLSPLTIRELAAVPAGTGLAFRLPQGMGEGEVLENLMGRYFKLNLVGRALQPDLSKATTLGGAVARLGITLVEGSRDPGKLGLDPRVWNPARTFNSARLLEWEITAFEWDVLDPRGRVNVRCEGVEQALSLPEEKIGRVGPLIFPQHPTLPAPWRVIEMGEGGEFWEQTLGATPEKAWEAFVDRERDFRDHCPNFEQGCSLEELLSRFPVRDADDCIVLEAAINRGHEQKYRIVQDHKDLPVIGRYELATVSTREGAKAREIWFERFSEVVSPGLPDGMKSLRYSLDKRSPKSPLRTFAMSFRPDSGIPRPECPECGKPCDRLVHLDLRRHPQGLKLPGSSLVMFTCSDDNLEGSWWHPQWMDRAGARTLLASCLEDADEVYSGPAFYDLDYEDARVDREAFNRDAARWPAFENSWEKSYFMFATPGTKVGGAPSWIQGDCTPDDREGRRMEFVAQFGCYDLIEIGDSGEAYVFISPASGETRVITQCF